MAARKAKCLKRGRHNKCLKRAHSVGRIRRRRRHHSMSGRRCRTAKGRYKKC